MRNVLRTKIVADLPLPASYDLETVKGIAEGNAELTETMRGLGYENIQIAQRPAAKRDPKPNGATRPKPGRPPKADELTEAAT